MPVQPVVVVQREYSLWARDLEADVLPACRELGIGFVPWSPLGQGFLTGAVNADQSFGASDVRSWSPRFTPDAMRANQALVDVVGQRELYLRRSLWHGCWSRGQGS